MSRSTLVFIILILVTLLTACSSPELCDDRVSWAPGSERTALDKNDSLFVCGDPAHPAWKDVPPRESASFLRSYLESKGYLDPKITIDFEANRVIVDAGRRAVITAILSENAPPDWSNGPLESNLGRSLEKSTLDQVEGAALGLLKGKGYACATLKLEAHPDGRIVLKLSPGTLKVFPTPVPAQGEDYPVPAQVLTRFEPFSPGDPFDVRETVLASRRLESEVASSAAYTSICEQDEFQRLERAASFGPRRSWEIGVGASTEEYPLSFIRWKTSRLWSSASRFQAEGFASNKRQKIDFDLKYYYLLAHPRLYLRPVFQFEHRNEFQYETYETKASIYQGRAIDTGDWTLEPEVGFSLRRLRILDTVAPRTNILLTPEVNFGAHSHDFELYRGDPRTGFDGTLSYGVIPANQASSLAVHRFLLQGTYLRNYRNYVEPRWVLGGRFTLGSLFTSDGTVPDPATTPPDWFFLAGGDHDLRGFGRYSLPSQQQGAGSVATWGFESRWPHLFSPPIEPLVFTDFGYLGSGNGKFDSILFLSPGFGVRSATPLGTIRATLARGLIPSRGVQRWQLFFSFGTEF